MPNKRNIISHHNLTASRTIKIANLPEANGAHLFVTTLIIESLHQERHLKVRGTLNILFGWHLPWRAYFK
jgi:hypothetical protein